MSSASELREIALVEFAGSGYSGTSIQRIADVAGLSKSAVLYHYASKELLLDAAIRPAIEEMEGMLADLESRPLTAEYREGFLLRFVDFLLENRLEVHLFINQGPSLVEVPAIGRANDLVRRLADYFASNTASTEEKMRFGIALGGAAYMLCTEQSLELEAAPVDEARGALITILTELLAPIGVRGDPIERIGT